MTTTSMVNRELETFAVSLYNHHVDICRWKIRGFGLREYSRAYCVAGKIFDLQLLTTLHL